MALIKISLFKTHTPMANPPRTATVRSLVPPRFVGVETAKQPRPPAGAPPGGSAYVLAVQDDQLPSLLEGSSSPANPRARCRAMTIL